ncbi:MAG: hypothetical protein ACPHO9_01345 [Ilumatobacteraceae bacterium]
MTIIDGGYSVPGPRDRVVVEGPDARRYLHSQLSQDIEALAVGGRVLSLVLDPDGKVAALVGVTCEGDDRFVLDVDPGSGEAVATRLLRFRLRTDASIEVLAADRARDAAEEAERIAAGWPAQGSEIIPGETLAAETGVVQFAVSFSKGCYPGQELVERMDSRGALPPRRIVRLEVSAGTAVGEAVTRDGERVGEITSVSGEHALARVGRAFTD